MFGGIDNILTAALHQDETTEHLQILLMPMDYKTFRFASSRFIDGPGGLSKLQDQFHEEVAKKHGLKRGRRRSRDKHVPMRGFYANSASAEAPELVPVPAPPTFLDHSKPDEYAKKKKAHDEAVQANRRAQKLLEEQALVGRSIHPEIRARMARHDEEFEQREAEVQAKSKRAAKQLQEAKDREKAAQERLNAAFNREAEARKLLQHIPKAWEKSDAQIFDKLTQLIPAAEVARMGIQMGIELVPGKPLLRQLLEKGVGMTLTESMSRLAKVIDGAHYSHAPSGQSYYEAAVDAQPVNRLKDF
jgi:hypothetical protein